MDEKPRFIEDSLFLRVSMFTKWQRKSFWAYLKKKKLTEKIESYSILYDKSRKVYIRKRTQYQTPGKK